MEQTITKAKVRRQFTGIVVSTAMQHTVVVRVDRVIVHPKYQKRYERSKKYHCDVRAIELAPGDRVIFEETRPLSKTKRWRIVSKV